MSPSETLRGSPGVTLEVKNVGAVAGAEVVQAAMWWKIKQDSNLKGESDFAIFFRTSIIETTHF